MHRLLDDSVGDILTRACKFLTGSLPTLSYTYKRYSFGAEPLLIVHLREARPPPPTPHHPFSRVSSELVTIVGPGSLVWNGAKRFSPSKASRVGDWLDPLVEYYFRTIAPLNQVAWSEGS